MNKFTTRANKGFDKKMVMIESGLLIAKLEEDRKTLLKQSKELLDKEDEKSMHIYWRLFEVIVYIEKFILQLKEGQENVIKSGGRFLDNLTLL
jgi:hypothetical protein